MDDTTDDLKCTEFNPKKYKLSTESLEYIFSDTNENVYSRVKCPLKIEMSTDGRFTFTVNNEFDILEGFAFDKKHSIPSSIIFRDSSDIIIQFDNVNWYIWYDTQH